MRELVREKESEIEELMSMQVEMLNAIKEQKVNNNYYYCCFELLLMIV